MALAAVVDQALTERGLSVAEVARLSAPDDPKIQLSKAKWTEIVKGQPPLSTKATIGKAARILRLDVNVLLAAAGYLPNVFISHAADDPDAAELTQLIVDMTEALQELRGEIRSMGTDLRSLVVTFQPQPPDVVPRRQHTLHEARQRDVRSRPQDQDSRP